MQQLGSAYRITNGLTLQPGSLEFGPVASFWERWPKSGGHQFTTDLHRMLVFQPQSHSGSKTVELL